MSTIYPGFVRTEGFPQDEELSAPRRWGHVPRALAPSVVRRGAFS